MFSTVNSSEVQSICGNAFDLILDADPDRTYNTWTRLTYEHLNMDFQTFNETEKIAIKVSKNVDSLKNHLEKYKEAKCILLKHPFGLIPWPTIRRHNFQALSSFSDADLQLLKNIIR